MFQKEIRRDAARVFEFVFNLRGNVWICIFEQSLILCSAKILVAILCHAKELVCNFMVCKRIVQREKFKTQT